MSLMQILGVMPMDLMPSGQAHVITLPNVSAPYQVSKRLFDAARELALKEGVSVSDVFRRLLEEVNSVEAAALTLSEKEQMLRATVALPTANDWCLLAGDEALVNRLNGALVEALDEAKSGKCATCGEIGKAIFDRLAVIEQDHPDAGISDSEGNSTVARFFAVNYAPSIHDYLRYYRASKGN